MEEFVKKIQIGEKFKVKFVSMTHDGKGVCKINGMLKNDSLAENFPIFVNNAISNEEGIIEITSLKKTLGNGKIIKLFKDKTSKYIIDANEIIPLIERLADCIEEEANVQLFNTRANVLTMNIDHLMRKYEGQPESYYESFKKLTEIAELLKNQT